MKLIQIKNYLLLIDEEAEIKEGDKFLADNVHMITCKGNSSKSFINNNFYRSKCAKIIAVI